MVSDEILLLAPPYGRGSGDSVSFLTDCGHVSDEMERVMLAYSCHPPALPKIRACLEASGRYDCELQPGWFRSQYANVKLDLKAIGITVRVNRLSEFDKRPLRMTRF